MRRLASFALLTILSFTCAGTTAYAQRMTPEQNARQSEKANKKQQKMLRKANKKQNKAAKKYAKSQRKATKKANKDLQKRRGLS